MTVNILTYLTTYSVQIGWTLLKYNYHSILLSLLISLIICYRSNKPYIMYGESGYGKTSLLAVASIRVFDWIGQDASVIVVRRFLGTTPDSTNVGSLLKSVTDQISLACK